MRRLGGSKWVVGGAVAFLVALAALAAVRASRPSMKMDEIHAPWEFAPTDLTRLATRPLTVELALPGTVQAVSQATVRAKVSAEISRIHVREGDPVVAGQVIAEFDTAPLRALLAEREAALASARAQLVQAQRTHETNARLARQNFISQNALDTSDSAVQAQSAQVDAARAQLEQTRLQLEDARVRAPISGQIARRLVQPGEKVAFDTELVSIIDLAALEVQVQAPVSDVGRLHVGAAAQVQVEGVDGPPIAGRIERINPGTDPGTRTIDLYVSIPNPHRELRAGMFARVHLALQAQRPGPAIALSAVQLDGADAVVWVLKSGRLTRRSVSLGRHDDRAQMVEILGGLSPDDRVLATRFDNLREGAEARVTGDPGQPPAAK
jgi:membrane fusion protein (multidrug efflux system)